MHVYKDTDGTEVRAHPWTTSDGERDGQYYDFVKNPEIIRTSLEDFLNHSDELFATNTYRMLEWINGRDSFLESNHCEYVSPYTNKNKYFKYKKQTKCYLMILFRDLIHNTQTARVDWLLNTIKTNILKRNKNFLPGTVGLSFHPIGIYALATGEKHAAIGNQVAIGMFGFGKNTEKANDNLASVIQIVHESLLQLQDQKPEWLLD